MAGKRNKKKRKQQKSTASSPWLWIVLGGLVVIAVGAVLFLNNSRRSSTGQTALPAEISVQQAYEKYQAGTYVLDVRTQAEWNEYHIPGTHLIPLDELESRLASLPKGEEIVVVCRSGNRSAVATQILRDNGFDATSMAGGVKAWRAAGYPVEP
ncbi:MAG TPA: rhodanese-like domain-containing protein [Chloroflexi bacterium]|nr:rhodanese-like domain-containing protein [Chloroflexota bacterium]